MRKIVLYSLLSLFFLGCKEEKKISNEVLEIPVSVELIRFDKEYMEIPENEFGNLKKKYPYLFPSTIADSTWLNKRKDTLFREIAQETAKQFQDTKKLEKDLKLLFQHIKYYFPKQNPGKVIGLISEVDTQTRSIYTDTLALISLDTYLGKSHRFYQDFDSYTLIDFEPNKIVSDLAERFIEQQPITAPDRTLLSQMIVGGKIMYAKDFLLPEISDALKIGYTDQQIKWCEANEVEMWKYFVESKLLYDTDPKLNGRFIQKAPFSKFYLELDAESPGSVGVWLGWQIVRSYMKNNDISLQELFMKDYKEIFEKSKYKPKK